MGILYGCYQGERASRLSTFSNLKVWNQTQLRLLFSKLKIWRLLILFNVWSLELAKRELGMQSSCYPPLPTDFQDRDCLGGREGLVWAFISQDPGTELQPKGMLSLSIRLSQLARVSVILWGFAKLSLCHFSVEHAAGSSREDKTPCSYNHNPPLCAVVRI